MGEILNLDQIIDCGQSLQPVEISSAPSFMLIGELSSATGVDPKTIRYYEREMLISPSRHGRFRVYVQSDLERLNRILTMRRMGLSIAHIRSLLNSKATSLTEGALAQVLLNHLEVLRQRQSEVTRQLKATTDVLQLCEL